MKIRSGFVSNSSSSSFVLMGIEIPKDKDDELTQRLDILERLGAKQDQIEMPFEDEYEMEDALYHMAESLQPYCIYIATDTEDGAPNNDVILVGKMLAETDNYNSVSKRVYTVDELVSAIDEIKAKLDKEDLEVKLYTGSRLT